MRVPHVAGLTWDCSSLVEAVFWLLNVCSSIALVRPVSVSPTFNDNPEHMVVVEGARVLLPCSVDFLTEHQTIIWVNPRKTLISYADRRMIDDHRLSVERPYNSVWNLLIREVRYNDSGVYECRINTTPEGIKRITLEVQVPPAIHSDSSSDREVVREGDTTTLNCNVTGIPEPTVTWYKRNHRSPGGSKEKIGLEGGLLILHNITRFCDDIYECFVDNGVPPAVSKAIRVVVEYPPEVNLPHPNVIGQQLGKETILECQIFAYPQAVTSWTKNGRVLTKSDKYDIDIFKNDLENSLSLALRVRDVSASDYGPYVCTASNHMGDDSKVMFLKEVKPPTTIPSTPSRTQIASTQPSRVTDSHLIRIQNSIPIADEFEDRRAQKESEFLSYMHGIRNRNGLNNQKELHALQEQPVTPSFQNSKNIQGMIG